MEVVHSMSSKVLPFDKLGEDNYVVWKVYMEVLLVRKQLIGYVDGSKAVPGDAPGSKAVVGFRRSQAEARTKIVLCLEPS